MGGVRRTACATPVPQLCLAAHGARIAAVEPGQAARATSGPRYLRYRRPLSWPPVRCAFTAALEKRLSTHNRILTSVDLLPAVCHTADWVLGLSLTNRAADLLPPGAVDDKARRCRHAHQPGRPAAGLLAVAKMGPLAHVTRCAAHQPGRTSGPTYRTAMY